MTQLMGPRLKSIIESKESDVLLGSEEETTGARRAVMASLVVASRVQKDERRGS